MITDPIDALDLLEVLDAVGAARSAIALSAALERLAVGAGLRRFALIQLQDAAHEVVAVLHNLVAPPQLEEPGAQALILRALGSRRFPEVLDQQVLPEMQYAVSAMWQEGMTTCVLMVGRDTEIAPRAAADLLGIVSLASSYSASALVSIAKTECPLTIRELECLVLFAAGSSAKETGRLLGVSPRTVEEYLARCKGRMGVRSTLAATAAALRRGWITNQDIDAAGVSVNRRYEAYRK